MRLVAVIATTLVVLASASAAAGGVRTLTITYVAHDGLPRRAYVVLPSWYRPGNATALPLVISPHGRGVPARANVRIWGGLPGVGRFAVVNPEGQGRVLTLYSWGDPGEIDDLARMPQLVREALPWLRIDTRRVFAVGGSMGGQEVLLLLARFFPLLAGVAAFDAPTDLALRYAQLPRQPFGHAVQALVRHEVGGTPSTRPLAYALRSPLDWAPEIAASRVPLQLWWSRTDRIVRNQAEQSGALFRAVLAVDPHAPIEEYVGTWRHSSEMGAKLPTALRQLGLWPPFAGVRLDHPGRTIVVRR